LALSVAGRPEEALQSYEKALEINPDFLTVLNNRGAVLHRLGRHAEAMQSYDRVLAIDPDYADAHNNRGALLRDLGRLDEARESCARAIKLRPSYPKFYLNFAYCHKFTSVDAHLSTMESMSCEASLSPDEQVELRFAVAKAYSDINEHQRSFAHLLEANRLKRQHVIYDERSALASFRHIRSAFSADMMRRKSGGGGSSTLPIFVVGMPRSGTSLVEQILASHSKVFGAGELPFFDSIARRTLAAVGGFPQGAPAATVDHLQKIGAEYIGRLRALAPPEITRIVDKMPGNFHHVGLIHLALPHARIVHARRSPADTCFSCFATLFAAPHPYSYDLGELASYYAAYQELMQHWRSVLPDGVMLEVEYETLVANFEEQSRRLLAHCGLEWQPACLDFYKTERLVHTASATQVRQPIYSTSIGRWRPYQQWLDPLLQGLQIAGLH
jgi:tetratricopeptide (TPR) repeat protein